MPRQRRRTTRKTNVFVQEAAPRGRAELEDEDAIAAIAGDEETEEAAPGAAIATSRSRRLRSQRTSRQARARSEIFTRSIGKEMRKLGMLSGVIAVTLVVLSFVL